VVVVTVVAAMEVARDRAKAANTGGEVRVVEEMEEMTAAA